MNSLYVEDNDELRETVCDLIADISLPGITCTELARRVLASHPQLWQVFCSGYDHDRR